MRLRYRVNSRHQHVAKLLRRMVIAAVICIVIPLHSVRAAGRHASVFANGCAEVSSVGGGLTGNCCCGCLCLKTLLCCETLNLDPPTDRTPHYPVPSIQFSYYDRPYNVSDLQRRLTPSACTATQARPWSAAFMQSIYEQHQSAWNARKPQPHQLRQHHLPEQQRLEPRLPLQSTPRQWQPAKVPLRIPSQPSANQQATPSPHVAESVPDSDQLQPNLPEPETAPAPAETFPAPPIEPWFAHPAPSTSAPLPLPAP